MQLVTRLALCLAAVLAVGAAGTSVASAAPPEFVPGGVQGFESIIPKKVKFETAKKTKVICTNGFDFGQVTGTKTMTITLLFQQCSIPGALCTTPGAEFGEIRTAGLEGTLGYIEAAKRKVGVDLVSPLGPIAMFTCGATVFVVEGSVIGRITPVNKLVSPGTPFKLKFMKKAGKQNPMSFEGGPVDVLQTSINGGPLEESALAAKDEVFIAGGPVEITA
jgi:hypothetical protein